jgi:hypothetical protein
MYHAHSIFTEIQNESLLQDSCTASLSKQFKFLALTKMYWIKSN